MRDVLAKYEGFLTECGCSVNTFYGDDFFNAKSFQDFNAHRNIRVVTCVAKKDHIQGSGGGDRLGIVDRLARTLKAMINKDMHDKGTTSCVRSLGRILDLYNSTPHASLPDSKCPDAVFGDREALVKIHLANRPHNLKVDMQQRTRWVTLCVMYYPNTRSKKEGSTGVRTSSRCLARLGTGNIADSYRGPSAAIIPC
jgi:hypothetical protein